MYTCAGSSTPRQPTAWLRPASQRMGRRAAWWSGLLPGCPSLRQRWVFQKPSGSFPLYPLAEQAASRLFKSHVVVGCQQTPSAQQAAPRLSSR